jgi:hypothetical protein
MCYLIREQQAGAAESGGAKLPPSPNRLRPRWVGAGAVALIGGLAMAALVAPQSTSPVLSTTAPVVNTKHAAPAPLASSGVAAPTGAVVERGSAPVDDGVPSSTDTVKAGMGDCHHGL